MLQKKFVKLGKRSWFVKIGLFSWNQFNSLKTEQMQFFRKIKVLLLSKYFVFFREIKISRVFSWNHFFTSIGGRPFSSVQTWSIKFSVKLLKVIFDFSNFFLISIQVLAPNRVGSQATTLPRKQTKIVKKQLIIGILTEIFYTRNYQNLLSHFFNKNFVKAQFLPKKLLMLLSRNIF